MRFQACTIITRSYLPQARLLYRSFRRFHPDTGFSALVFDAPRAAINEPFNVFSLEEIGLPAGEETRMPMLYDVTELATALKPWFFRHLLKRQRTELLYFDPDIEIFSPVDRLAKLAKAHCLVLTPHTTRPMSRENVRPNETDILSAGAYNLGFLGLNADCDSFLDWWSDRLLREAMIDVANMRFTDQRWMDFAPGYFDTHILKDETCNVAYWNGDSRPLVWTGNEYQINGAPLCFFHFSGFNPEHPHLLSKYQGVNPRTRFSDHPVLARLCQDYSQKLTDAGYAELHDVAYGWDAAPDGLKITRPMRFAYRAALLKHEQEGTLAPPTPFVNPDKFVQWLNELPCPRGGPEITRYFSAIHDCRPDVRAAFPDVPGLDNRRYYEWLRDHGRHTLHIPEQLMPRPATATISADQKFTIAPQPGVNLIGYLRAEAGTGEAARLMAAGLKASGEKYSSYVWSEAPSRQDHPWNCESNGTPPNYDTNLLCVNADQLPRVIQQMGPDVFQHRYNIGLWFWEVDVFPETMHSAFDFLHELWVASDFVRDAMIKASPIPVFTIPLALNVEQRCLPAPSRSALQLPEGFLFLFSFDFYSVVERKNPVAVIEAFKRAFKPGEGPVLVIKSINGNRYLAEMERLHHARGDRSDIIIRDGYLSAGDRDSLMAACDCYVSLHRSEGFGLTMAEAMLLEKPTIATRYSGNLEFMTDANSFLCGYQPRRVGPGHDPYPPDACWAEPNVDDAAHLMRLVYENRDEARKRGRQARIDLCQNHDPRGTGAFIQQRLTQLRRKPPTENLTADRRNERPVLTSVRRLFERGVDVRQTVPSLLTWLIQGPRRAMKIFLRAYDEHNRRVGLHSVDALSHIDAEWSRDRSSLRKRLAEQEDELRSLKQELQETQDRIAALEQENQQQELPSPRRPNGIGQADEDDQTWHRTGVV